MVPTKKELQEIKSLEDELIAAQQLEVVIDSDKSIIARRIAKVAGKPSFYDDPKAMQAVIDDMKDVIREYTKQAGNKGRLLSKNAMDKFLAASETRSRTDKALRIINQMNDRQAERRLGVYLAELEQSAGILKSDIKIFKMNARVAGFTKKETLTQLVKQGIDKTGSAQSFVKSARQVAKIAIRRERTAAEIAEYKTFAKPKELWVWITISSKPCPDCEARAGVALPIERWQKMGLPGEGRTVCGKYCRCKIYPQSIADDRFPEVRVFDWDKDKLVLTTASEERTLKAKSNQYKGDVKK